MDLDALGNEATVRFLLGKGGVGKTAITCAMGRALASTGRRVLLVELEGRPEILRAFGAEGDLGYDEQVVFEDPSGGSVIARHITPDEALLEYLDDHGLARLSRRLLASGVIDVVAGAIPGIREVLLLGKVKQVANESGADVVLVDCPATGHAVTLLTSATGVASAARSGPVRAQADEVVAMLTDPARSSVVLVTIPEELPVTETVEAAFRIEEEAGMALSLVIANRADLPLEDLDVPAAVAATAAGVELDAATLAALDAAAAFERHQIDTCSEQLLRLKTELPLPLVVLPRLAAPAIGPEEVGELASLLAAATIDRDAP
jgi:anion-transporting  ArsA/GET3 family ATPase